MKKLVWETDAQVAFDTATQGVLRQGGPSVTADYADGFISLACRLRGDGGCKCAIGHLITDTDYSDAMEGKSVVTIFSSAPTLLLCLQSDHDRHSRSGNFLKEYALASLITALNFNLSAEKLKQTMEELGI